MALAWKKAARTALHGSGALAALRLWRCSTFRVLMFHDFQESSRENLDSICAHVARHYEPVPLSMMAAAIAGEVKLPPNAVTVTVDDGYKNFLLFGYPSFARHRIPTTVYPVSGFSDGRLWLWTDQVWFAFQHTARTSISVQLPERGVLSFDLSSPVAKERATGKLWEILKTLPNELRLKLVADLPQLCRIEIPRDPPPDRAALSWDELRALAADGVEIGCHTDTHPILVRISDRSELEREIRGAKELIEARLQRPVVHFCYPNGRDADISDAAVECVRQAGFATAVTCTYGLNTAAANPLRIMRLPFGPDINLEYAKEMLVGLHLTSANRSNDGLVPTDLPPQMLPGTPHPG